MGLFRVFLGVESFAQAGLDTLGRGVDREVNHTALAMLDDLGIHTCYNLLVFDPETRLDDLRENIAFIRRWPTVPVNFGRVEVYSGTPLESSLRAQGRLLGDIFGYHYEIRDPAARAAFAMYRRVFLPRNFDHDGLASASMKLDYLRHLLSHFHPRLADPALARRASALVATLNGSQADLLERICDFLDTDPLPDDGEIGRQSRMLARERERFDERLAPRLEALVGEIEDRAAGRPVFHAGLVARAASAAAVAVVVGAAGCKQPAEDRDTTVTPSPVVEEEVPDVVEAEPEPEPPPAEPPPPETEQDASTDPTTGEAVEPPGAPVGKTPKKPRKPKKPKHPSKGLPPDYNEMLMYPMGLDDD